MQHKALIVFIKNIVPGKVKTRLAATVGNDRAVEIYRALLHRTRQEALLVDADRFVFYSHEVEKDDDWADAHFSKTTQRGSDIGERMANAFADVFPKYKKAVLIGGDIADISAGIIEMGLEKLDTCDFVLGPASDGGYYLIGMKVPSPTVFENIAWSTKDVSVSTIQNILTLGKTYCLLSTLSDIDYEEDWIEHGWDI